MITLLFTTILPQLNIAEKHVLTPFKKISFPHQGSQPHIYPGALTVIPTHLFIEDKTKTLIVLHHPDGLSLYDLPSGELKQTYALARTHPFHVEYQDSIITFFDRDQIRTFNLKTEVEEHTPEKEKLPLSARLISTHPQYGQGILKNSQFAHLVTKNLFLEISQTNSWNNSFTGQCYFVKRAYPSGRELSRAPVPYVTSLLDTYMTLDRKKLGIQSPDQKAILLYSVPDLRRIGKVPASEGKFAFDPSALWAVGFGRHHGLSIQGTIQPSLTNIKTGKHYDLEFKLERYYGSEASAGAVSDKLGIAVVANRREPIHLYRLPR